MKRIAYVGAQFLTTDDVAAALMQYARTLAVLGSADVVGIPVVDGDGVPRSAEFLLGPSSELLCIDVPDAHTPLPDADQAAEELRQRARRRLPELTDVLAAYEQQP
jgi:hypothetical protein